MRIFLYEYITGGGTWHTTGAIDPDGSLLAEGAAMAVAIAADLAAIDGVEVATMLDARLADRTGFSGARCVVVSSADEESAAFDEQVRAADATLLIAPEIDGILVKRCRQVEALGGRLLSPDSRFVELAADKQATAERLARERVPVPAGVRLASGDNARFPLPAVLKPCDGAGSWRVTIVESRDQLLKILDDPQMERELGRGNLRLERFVPGIAASVAVLCGPSGPIVLEPCEQLLDRNLSYLGGRLPLTEGLAGRARRLAAAAIGALPKTTGYVGIDLILGAARDGSEDFVIEVNPRLTTSYIGLRRACRQNLAEAMLGTASGRPAAVSFGREPVEFRADGHIERPGQVA